MPARIRAALLQADLDALEAVVGTCGVAGTLGPPEVAGGSVTFALARPAFVARPIEP